jgi:GT2 family glycosyltransferase
MDLTVVICTHNRAGLLGQTLDALARARRPDGVRAEVLVVANACSDDTHALLAKAQQEPAWRDLPLRWLAEPRAGKSYALNRAIAETDAAALCFIDDDQFIDQAFLTTLAEALATHPDYGILCGRIRPAWDGREPAWVHATGRYYIPIRPFPEYDFGDEPKDIPADHKLPSGGNITVRRWVFEQVGAFSTELGPQGHNLMGGEDHEFLQRCLARGVRILYVPGLKQLHAIEPERMRTGYMLRKSYLRSLSARRMSREPAQGLRPYLVMKPVQYALYALLSLNANRRFHYLIRMAAALGELRAAIDPRVDANHLENRQSTGPAP